MKTIGSMFKLAAVSVALVCGAGTASAVALSNTASNGGTNLLNDFNGGTTYSASWTGAQQMNDGIGSYWVYCTDPKTGFSNNTNVYTEVTLSNFLTGSGYTDQMTSAGYAGLAYTAQAAATVQANLINLFSHAYADGLSNATKAAAFGFAVWSIIGESGANLSATAGALRSEGSLAGAANDALDTQIGAYMTALTSNAWGAVNGANLTTATAYTYTVYADLAPHTSQNFIKVVPGGGGAGGGGVPEPGSLALVALAALGVFGARRAAPKA